MKKVFLFVISVLCIYHTTAQTDSLKYVQLKTTSKDLLVGKLIAKDDQFIVLETMDGIRKEFRTYEIKEVLAIDKRDIHKGKYWFPDPNRHRYIAGSSAVPLKRGNGYVQSFFVSLNYVAIGISDHFSFGIGTIIDEDTFANGPYGTFMNLRYSSQITTNLYLASEFICIAEDVRLSAFSKSNNTLTFAGRGMITYLNQRWNITGSIGYGLVRHQIYSYNYTTNKEIRTITNLRFENPLYTLSARLRLARRFGLVMENNLLPMISYKYEFKNGYLHVDKSPFRMVNALGFNFMGKRWSMGLGAFSSISEFGTDDFVLPYLDISYKFGK